MTEAVSKIDLRHVKLLLIEDERLIRDIVVRMLKTIGISEITEAASAEAAWSYIAGDQRRPLHVIITDLTLPGVSGGVLLKKLRELPSPRAKTLPVIVLTGSTDLGTYKKIEGSGVSSYLIKPISADLLRSAIEKALASPAPKSNMPGGISQSR